MDEIIDMLRNKTIMGRFSRGEIRDFLERLEVEGLVIAPIAKEPEPDHPEPIPEPGPAVTEPEPEPSVEPAPIGPVAPHD